MEGKFYHTYFKSGDKYSYAQLFCIKEDKIHWVPSDFFIQENEVAGIFDNSLSDEENIRKTYHQLYQAHDSFHLIICKSDLNQGEHYPNIYRPIFSRRYTTERDLEAFFPLYDQAEYISRLNQLSIIYHDLSDIFTYVEPDFSNNMKAYGHKIRNNIILSCTEIDSMFQNLMLKNGYKDKEHRFNTGDYIKTKSILKLDQYVIKYIRYPNLTTFSPFIDWNNLKKNKKDNPATESICWYNDYNQIKHDRINNKMLANINNAVDAFSAAIILFISQYGDDEPFWKKDFGDEIIIKQKPHYEYNEFYLPPISSENISWTEKQYTFK